MTAEETLGERVRRIRNLRGLTQAQLAEKARMERTDINKLEKDRLPLGPERLGRVATALKVSVLELQPKADPDARGQDLHDRLEALEADRKRDRAAFDRAVRGVLARLAALEEEAETRERRANHPRKGKRDAS